MYCIYFRAYGAKSMLPTGSNQVNVVYLFLQTFMCQHVSIMIDLKQKQGRYFVFFKAKLVSAIYIPALAVDLSDLTE